MDPVDATAWVYADAVTQYLGTQEKQYRLVKSAIRHEQRGGVIEYFTRFLECKGRGTPTFHRAVGILDLAVQRDPTLLAEYVLVSATSVLIAAKVEEKNSLILRIDSIKDDFKVSRYELKNMEARMLYVLDFSVTFPIPTDFAEVFLSGGVASWPVLQGSLSKVRYMSHYILELSMFDLYISECTSYAIMAAAIGVACKVIRTNHSELECEEETASRCDHCRELGVRCLVGRMSEACGVTENMLLPLMKRMALILSLATNHRGEERRGQRAATWKYLQDKYLAAAHQDGYDIAVVEKLSKMDTRTLHVATPHKPSVHQEESQRAVVQTATPSEDEMSIKTDRYTYVRMCEGISELYSQLCNHHCLMP